MMRVLADAYEQVGKVLTEEGFPAAYYVVKLECWNHRRPDASMDVGWNITALGGGIVGSEKQHCLTAYHHATLENALADLREQLQREGKR